MTAPAGASATLPDLSVQSFAACEVGRDTRLIGAAADADTVYLVLAGKLHLAAGDRAVVAGTGTMVLVPTGSKPSIASCAAPSHEVVATPERLTQRGGLLVLDAAAGEPGVLRVLVGRVRGNLTGSMTETLSDGTPMVVDLRGFPLARSAYVALREELDRPNPGFPAMAAVLMKACVLLFARATRVGRSAVPHTPAGHRIAAVAAAIRARPSDPYSTESLATRAGMSRATFSRQFLHHIGITPMGFVQQARLRDAASLLRTTALSVKQIASDAGFRSRSHFSRAFQAQFGTDPTAFRGAIATAEAQSPAAAVPLVMDPGA